MSETQPEIITENKIVADSCNETKPKNSSKVGKNMITFFTCGLCTHTNREPENEMNKPKPKMKKNKSVSGTIEFETATNVEMFRNILDNSIIGTKLVSKGVMCSKSSGKIIACNPPDYTPSVEQINSIISGFENIDVLKTEGFIIVSDLYEPTGYSSDEISAKTKGDGEYFEALILQTNTALIIGISPNPVEHIRDLLTAIRDSIKNGGY